MDYIRIVLLVSALLIELRIFMNVRRAKSMKHDRGSLKALTFCVVLGIAAFFFFVFSKIGKLPADTSRWGLAAVVAGLFLRQWAIRTLGRFFTPVVSSEQHHTIIAAGPYRYLRHPSYTGLVLEFAGAALAISNIAAFFVMLICIIPALRYRIRIEEAFLTDKFGDAYSAFQKRTPRIFP